MEALSRILSGQSLTPHQLKWGRRVCHRLVRNGRNSVHRYADWLGAVTAAFSILVIALREEVVLTR